MCPNCKSTTKVLTHPVPYTLLLSAGILVWLSALFSVGALLLH